MIDVALETVRALILLGIVVFLLRVGRGEVDAARKGWNLIIAGFGLLLFGSLIDITDNFEALNRFVVVGDTETEAFLEKFVGFLGGFLVLAWGLVLWMPQIQLLSTEITERKRAEASLGQALKALNVSQTQLQGVFDNTPVCLNLKDTEGRYLLINKPYEDWLGHSAEEIIGKKASEFLTRESEIEDLSAAEKIVLETGEVFKREVSVERADGRIYHRILIKYPVKGADGSIGAIGTVAVDVTERKEIEDELKELNEKLEDRIKAGIDEVREFEGRFRHAFENAPIGVALITPDGNRFQVNQALADFLGYSVEELTDTTMNSTAGDTGDLDKSMILRQKVLDGEIDSYRNERRYRHKDGHIIWGEVSGALYRKPNGEPGHFIAHTIDITERKQAEIALRESEDLFSRTFHASPGLFVISRPEDGAHFDVNRTWIETTGYSHEEAMAHSALELGIWADANQRERFVASLEKDGSVREFEAKFRIKDGREIDVLVAGEYMEVGGEPRLLIVSHDITERKRAEEQLSETTDLLTAVLEHSPAQIYLKDKEGRHVLVSRETERLYARPGETVIGKTAHDLFPEESADSHQAHDREVIETRKAITKEYDISDEDELHTFLAVKFPILDAAGNVTLIGAITSDITEHKRIEEQLRQAQKMEAVGQLTGGVAHDFNNLLAVIMGNAELLEERLGRTDIELGPILHAARRGAELTQRLLAFSRMQSLRPRVIDLDELISGMSIMLTRTLGETIEIATAVAPDLENAFADPGQVENAVLNLVLNARDAMPRGGKLTIDCANVRLEDAYVAANPEASTGNYVVIAVSDEGCGMTREVQAHAFEPFFTTKEVGQGSGLGLSMIYGFAKQSGGHVNIYSEEGKGTTVKLYLPRAGDSVRVEGVSLDEGTLRGRGETVLVIEDDPEVRALAARMLENLGYRVIDAADAASAHEALAEAMSVDLVLSDVVLPGGASGPEFAKQARTTRPDLKIIFMSGYPAEAAKRNGFLGSDQVLLNKPFQKRQLAKAVREALG